MFQAGFTGKDNPNVMVKRQPKIRTTTDYNKYYKIVLRSRDANSWSYNNAGNGAPNQHIFNEITFPDGLHGNVIMIMESFVAENAAAELDGGYTVSIKEIIQPRTWGTDKQGPTDIVLTGKGSVWQNGSVCSDSCGIPISNAAFFRNATMTVKIDSIRLADPNFKVQGDWVLTFWLVQMDNENDF